MLVKPTQAGADGERRGAESSFQIHLRHLPLFKGQVQVPDHELTSSTIDPPPTGYRSAASTRRCPLLSRSVQLPVATAAGRGHHLGKAGVAARVGCRPPPVDKT